MLLATQTLAMVQSALLAALALGGVIRVWQIVALNVMQGLIDAFDMPARQSMIVRMVDDRADLPNAIALNSSMVNGGRLLGPAIAGVLIAAFGEGWCFLIDALSYAAVLTSVLMMRVDAGPPAPRTAHVLRDMADGFRYVSDFAPIRALLVLLAVSGLAGRPFAVLLPVIAHEVMHGGAGTLGFLQATAGVGALAGALYLAWRTSVLGLGRVVVISAAAFGVGLVAFSRAHALWLATPLLLVAGTGMMVQTAASNTIIQTIVVEDKRGRVMSILAMSLFGTVPIGSLAAGALATRIGAENTILAGGLVCVLAAGVVRPGAARSAEGRAADLRADGDPRPAPALLRRRAAVLVDEGLVDRERGGDRDEVSPQATRRALPVDGSPRRRAKERRGYVASGPRAAPGGTRWSRPSSRSCRWASSRG